MVNCGIMINIFVYLLMFFSGSAFASEALNKLSNYMVYYGVWDETKIQQAFEFELVILAPGPTDANIDANLVSRLKKGKDGVAGTKDDIIVLAYISIGEDVNIERGPRQLKDGYRGPVYEGTNGKMVQGNNGFREWYLDEVEYAFTKDHNKIWGEDGLPKTTKGHDKIPDENGKWHSFNVNVGNADWHALLQKKMTVYLDSYKCDGLFLDTVDTASPWNAYGYLQQAMVDLLVSIRGWFPKTTLVMNRGLFLFEKYGETLNHNIDGVMFESYLNDWDWYNKIGVPLKWFGANEHTLYNDIKPLNQQKNGITVLFLHYLDPTQPEAPLFYYSMSRTADLNAIHYIADPTLAQINHPYYVIKQKTMPEMPLRPMQGLRIPIDDWKNTPRTYMWYSLKNKVGPGFQRTPFLWLVPAAKFLDLADITPGDYDLEVHQVDPRGNLLRSAHASINIPAQDRPAMVPGVELQVRDGSLRLSWTAVPGADKYLIKWGSNRFALRDEVTVSQTENIFTNLKNNTVYYFKVAALSGKKIGYPSDVNYAAPTNTTPPKTPQLMSVKVTKNCIDVQWVASTDVAGYLIYADPVGLTQGLALQIPQGQTSSCVSVPKPGKYVVRLAGYDANNNESPSTPPKTVTVH